jgi:hypothetical protein
MYCKPINSGLTFHTGFASGGSIEVEEEEEEEECIANIFSVQSGSVFRNFKYCQMRMCSKYYELFKQGM